VWAVMICSAILCYYTTSISTYFKAYFAWTPCCPQPALRDTNYPCLKCLAPLLGISPSLIYHRCCGYGIFCRDSQICWIPLMVVYPLNRWNIQVRLKCWTLTYLGNRDMKNPRLEKCCSSQNWAKSVVLSMAVMERRLSAQLCSRVLK